MQVEESTTIVFMNDKDVGACLRTKEYVSPLFKEFLARLLFQVRSIRHEALREATLDPARMVAILASGQEKAMAVYALCRAGIADTIIIDNPLAMAIKLIASEHRWQQPVGIRNVSGLLPEYAI